MSTLQIPATKPVASHCAICSRALKDAESVELGIGPVCRKKYGFNAKLDPKVRAAANDIVHRIAVQQSGPEIPALVNELVELGLPVLSGAIAKRVAIVQIVEDAERLSVHTPYDPDVIADMRAIKGRRWDKVTKTNTFPANARPALWRLLRLRFPGAIASGPKGLFAIPSLGNPSGWKFPRS